MPKIEIALKTINTKELKVLAPIPFINNVVKALDNILVKNDNTNFSYLSIRSPYLNFSLNNTPPPPENLLKFIFNLFAILPRRILKFSLKFIDIWL